MENEQRTELLAVADGASDANEDRQRAVEQLFISNFGFIQDSALSDRRLLVLDGKQIAEGLAQHLPSYTGPLTDEAFQAWALDVIRPAVKHTSKFYEVFAAHEKAVLAGVWSVLKNARDLADDAPRRTAQMLAQDTWVWIFQHLGSLLEPGTASLGTRLRQRGYWTARAWKTARLRERDKLADIDASQLGREDYAFEVSPIYVQPDWDEESQAAY